MVELLSDFVLFAVIAYGGVMFARILLSWVPVAPPPALRPVFSFLYDVTDPFLRLFRGLLPPIGGFDLSPILAFVVLYILEAILRSVLP
ncbi:MAG TPA: YggT family protein [Actinomycetota bacterium]|nr:YggT family protein [Actinomycetota bacterium]